jgi:hypothetical protein
MEVFMAKLISILLIPFVFLACEWTAFDEVTESGIETQGGMTDNETSSNDSDFYSSTKSLVSPEDEQDIVNISEGLTPLEETVDETAEETSETEEEVTEASSDDSVSNKKSYIIHFTWGQMRFNSDILEQTDYSGTLSVNNPYAEINLLRLIAFESNDSLDTETIATDSSVGISWTSKTSSHKDGILVKIDFDYSTYTGSDDIQALIDNSTLTISFDNQTNLEPIEVSFSEIGSDLLTVPPYRLQPRDCSLASHEIKGKNMGDKCTMLAFKLREGDLDGGPVHGRTARLTKGMGRNDAGVLFGRWANARVEDYSLGFIGGIWNHLENAVYGKYVGLITRSKNQRACFTGTVSDCTDKGNLRSFIGVFYKDPQENMPHQVTYNHIALVYEEPEAYKGCFVPVGIMVGDAITIKEQKAHVRGFFNGVWQAFYSTSDSAYATNVSAYCASTEDRTLNVESLKDKIDDLPSVYDEFIANKVLN